MTENWTVLSLLKWAQDYFKTKNIESPRLTAELLLGHVLTLKKIELYTNFERPLSAEELASFKELLKRRVNKEPLDYILGEKEFLDFKVKVDKNVLVPRPETEQLIEFVMDFIKLNRIDLNNYSVIDLGVGSGVIAIALARLECPVLAVDISHEALDVALKNSQDNKLENIIFKKGNFLDALDSEFFEKPLFIVSNPPYLTKDEMQTISPEVSKEPEGALSGGDDGTQAYRTILDQLKQKSKKQSICFFEISSATADSLNTLFEPHFEEIVIKKDFAGEQRFLLANSFKK